MGMDAYAIDHDGKRLPTAERTGTNHPELVNVEQRRAFQQAARLVAEVVGGVDADLDVGELGISAYASAVNHIMFAHGGRCDDDQRYSAEHVLEVKIEIVNESAIKIPEYIANDTDALAHAAAFIATCAKLGLGIQISP